MEKKQTELMINSLVTERQGEGLAIGRLATFVNFCNVNITAANDEYKRKMDVGQLIPIKKLIERIEGEYAKYVVLGGGEPLIQKKQVIELSEELIKRGYEVELRTNSTIDWNGVPKEVVIDLNLYSPSSKVEKYNNYEAIKKLTKKDQLKLGVLDKRDYEWVEYVLDLHKPERETNVFILPIGIYARSLFKWSKRETRARVMLRNLRIVRGE